MLRVSKAQSKARSAHTLNPKPFTPNRLYVARKQESFLATYRKLSCRNETDCMSQESRVHHGGDAREVDSTCVHFNEDAAEGPHVDCMRI